MTLRRYRCAQDIKARKAVHKGTSYPGEHQAIIDHPLWDQVHAILQESPRQRAANTRTQTPALLKGLIFTDRGIAMTPTVTKKGSRHYRYYTSMDAIRNRACEGRDSFVRLNAGMVEGAVVQHIRSLLRTPEIAARAMEAARRNDPDMPAYWMDMRFPLLRYLRGHSAERGPG